MCVYRNGGRVVRKAVHTFHEKSWYVFVFPLFDYLPVILYIFCYIVSNTDLLTVNTELVFSVAVLLYVRIHNYPYLCI